MTGKRILVEVMWDSADDLCVERPVGCSSIRVLNVALDAFSREVGVVRKGVLV
jgi:hypothetical protein